MVMERETGDELGFRGFRNCCGTVPGDSVHWILQRSVELNIESKGST